MQIMMETLQRGQIATFIAFFARYAEGCQPGSIHDSLRQTCPKGLAIACRALGVQEGGFFAHISDDQPHAFARPGHQPAGYDRFSPISTKIRPEVAQRIIKRTV